MCNEMSSRIISFQDKNDFFVPIGVNKVEKVPGRLPVRVFGLKNKNHQVTGRYKPLRNLLVLGHNTVRSWRIHNGNFLQNFHRKVDLFQVWIYYREENSNTFDASAFKTFRVKSNPFGAVRLSMKDFGEKWITEWTETPYVNNAAAAARLTITTS